ncbi:two-component sensor histidine kinase [Nocardiopsis sp. CNR-923]|uniref:sensor histidine kinase n=1 Tax=Nocardiopsis sp. CNR-923 TaxID=1904965 RepID=UPI0009680EA6|nr:HAMP domain-containing sensor histidine kinase [Nocardiopsis sp. CNR-923]OLT27959.1 two-component sensor histidine kinase [Nocardiopsis sp. CNR-923]
MARRRGALRHSLLARMLASSVLVAVCSITATAWLAVQGTSESIGSDQGETLAADTRIHDTLVGYAATHPDWDAVDATVDELAEETGRRIVLATENRRLLADSEAGSEAHLPPRASSVVDPLAVDVTLVSEGADRVDARAVGPFALADEDRRLLETVAAGAVDCLRDEWGLSAVVETAPSGRPYLAVADGAEELVFAQEYCGFDELEEPTDGEREVLKTLVALTGDCLGDEDPQVRFRMDAATGSVLAVPTAGALGAPADEAPAPSPREEGGAPSPGPGPFPPDSTEPADSGEEPTWIEDDDSVEFEAEELAARERAREEELTEETGPPAAPGNIVGPQSPALDQRTADCVASARRELLRPYVAPAALLFIDDPSADTAAAPSLSREGLLRVSGVVLLVLLLTVGVSVAVSTRLVRPVRALTDAVTRMRQGRGAARVEVRDSGEIGELAAAFNEMSEHLEQLEDQRKAMVSDVSHELRTPLSNLRGWLEAVQDGVADLEPERMEMLVGETLLLQEIIDDLRDLALADAGKLRLSLELVEARGLVEQLAASYRLRADEAGLGLVTETSDVVLRADRTRLFQAVGNLVGNALRHTSEGTVTVRVRAEGDDAVFEVADTGTGIAAEDLPYVFDRFWRAEKSRSRQTGGSGLGLAIVRNLTELHGGRVSVESVLGEGTTFTLRLPLVGP